MPPDYPPLICPNGHGSPPSANVRFCSQCGAAFVPAAPMNGVQGANGWGQAPYPQQPYSPQPYPPQPMTPNGVPMPPQQQPTAAPPPMAVGAPVTLCAVCGGDGTTLNASLVICPQCRWLRPLAPGYVVHPNAFQWGADSIAMAKLRSIGPLMAAARTVSDKIGRPWVESSFNAILLGENQLPDIYRVAIQAGRLLGMPFMPDIYISGDKMWDAVTYGSDRSAFLLIGTALINNYKGDDLLYLLAREMGHCRAGHALWKTVGMFLTGQQGPHAGVLAGGITGLLNPDKLVQSAIEVPFLAWARQAEITADRAGMLAIGDEETARRVLLSWSLRSVPLYRQINIEAWLQQQEDSDTQLTRMSEMVNSATPYITRRLKLLTQFAQSPELAQMRAVIGPLQEQAAPKTPAAPPPIQAAPPPPVQVAAPKPVQAPAPPVPTAAPDSKPTEAKAPTPSADTVRVTCPTCGTGMRVPRSELAGKDVFRVKCPNPQCGKILTMQKKAGAAPPPPPTPTPAAA